MDLYIITGIVAFFMVLLMVGVSPLWALVAIFFFAIFILSIKYPNGRYDWHYDWKTTAYMFFMLLSLVVIMLILYMASRVIILPDPVTFIVYTSIAGYITLLILTIVFPDGLGIKI